MGPEKLVIIDQLIQGWSNWETEGAYYLGELVPSIVEHGETALGLDSREKELVLKLKGCLTENEWRNLPKTVKERKVQREKSINENLLERKLAREEEERKRREVQESLRRLEEEKHKKMQEEKEREEEKRKIKEIIWKFFESDYLNIDKQIELDSARDFLSENEFIELKGQFLQMWAKREIKEDLDLEQSKSAALFGGDIRIIARAGSGKTRTLLARTLFLQKHCGINPGEILILAFNKSTEKQVREKLKKYLFNEEIPHVMTFHALAYALVHPEETLLYDGLDENNLGLSREVQRIIDKHLRSKIFREKIRDLMLMHFQEDWEKISKGGFHLPLDELIAFREALPRETLRGDYVKSFGEKSIANILFRNDIDYRYEWNFRWDGVNYRPDFIIPTAENRGIVIEYFGLEGDPDYDEMSNEKRRFWKGQDNWTLIELFPQDIISRQVDGFEKMLLNRLKDLGIKMTPLGQEELWKRINERAIDQFTNAMKSFVSRCRKLNLTSNSLQGFVASYLPITKAESLFLEVALSIYDNYLLNLAENKKQDFDGLMWDAVNCLENGQSTFARDRGRERGDVKKLRYILVDEFQDFSEMFYSLLQGIRRLNPSVEFFFVGDDWQAINGFAGSELKYFAQFEEYFRNPKTLEISTNYRSPAQIVQVGNALMKDLGTPAKAYRKQYGEVKTAYLDTFESSLFENNKHKGDVCTPAVLRLLKKYFDAGKNNDPERGIVILSRVNRTPGYVQRHNNHQKVGNLEDFADYLRSFFPEEVRNRIEISTAHRYKGLEKEAVIILDANRGRFPLIHPNWVFLRIFGDGIKKIVNEEQRLFYVALTRSKRYLYVISSDSRSESPFLQSIRSVFPLDSIDWRDYDPVPSGGKHLEIQVKNCYGVKDKLKDRGFQWYQKNKVWKKLIIADDFNFDELCQQSWVEDSVDITVFSDEGEVIYAKPKGTSATKRGLPLKRKKGKVSDLHGLLPK